MRGHTSTNTGAHASHLGAKSGAQLPGCKKAALDTVITGLLSAATDVAAKKWALEGLQTTHSQLGVVLADAALSAGDK